MSERSDFGGSCASAKVVIENSKLKIASFNRKALVAFTRAFLLKE
jgi:hypothetical protein